MDGFLLAYELRGAYAARMSLDAAKRRLEKAEKNSAAALVELHQAKRAFDEAFAAKFGQGELPVAKTAPKSPAKTPVTPTKAKGPMSDEELKNAIKALNKEDPAISDKKKAERLGVSVSRVYLVRKKFGIKGLRGPKLGSVPPEKPDDHLHPEKWGQLGKASKKGKNKSPEQPDDHLHPENWTPTAPAAPSTEQVSNPPPAQNPAAPQSAGS